MEKLWLIIKREYLTRVKKRSFILATLLTPLAFLVFFVVVGFIFSYETDEVKKIAIIDEGNILNKTFKDGRNLFFSFPTESLDQLKKDYEKNDYDGIILIPTITDLKSKKHTTFYYSDDQLDLDLSSTLQKEIEKKIRDYKITSLGLDKKELESLRTNVTIDPEPILDTGEDASTMTSVIASGLGGVMGFVMYFVLFIYGMMVMRSVMEEKISRIVEVMISSVKPFQLMLGKIIGVGAVGLTQLGIWMIVIPLISILAQTFFPMDPTNIPGSEMAGEVDPEDAAGMVMQVLNELSGLNWWLIVPLFIFYFLGGYILYSSLFAAVGSAMGDDLGEGQALTLPITIPVIMALYIMFVSVRSPHSSLAIWSSIFPLFSPIVMPARLAFNPPAWEIILSVIVMIASVFFFVWLSARIYRVGILMYGKKVSFKELGKWIFYKD